MYLMRRLLVEVGRQQVGVPRLGAAVAADVEVVALLGGDQAEVLALGLGAFADAAGDGGLDLVRRADAAIALLDADGEADGVLHAVAAPGRADAALHRAQGLAIGVAALHAGGDHLFPDVGQLLHLRAEQIDALAAGDLGVQAVLLGDAAQGDELVGRDLAAGHARHHGVQPAALHVGQEAVVGVLQRLVRRDRGCSRSTGWPGSRPRPACRFRSRAPRAVAGEQLVERFDLLDLDDLEQLLPACRQSARTGG